MTGRVDASRHGGIALRAAFAVLALVAFSALAPRLDEGSLVAARFGLGLVLFVLLIDVGRSSAGAGPPVRGALGPHRQQADPRVDEAYDRARSSVGAYLDEGTLDAELLDRVEAAAGAQRLTEEETRSLRERLRRAADATRPPPLLAVRMLSGLVVTAGVALLAAVLAEHLGLPLSPPVLLAVGTSLATLQWRAREAGANAIGLAVGLAGVGAFGLGALQLFRAAPVLGGLLLVATAGGLLATLAATRGALASDRQPNAEDLGRSVVGLRRAFLVVVVASLVVFALEPALDAALATLGLPQRLLVDLARVGLATVLVFLAIEGAGTWLARRRTDEAGGRGRRRRALDAVIEAIETSEDPTSGEAGE